MATGQNDETQADAYALEKSRQRAERINERDYFRRRTPLELWKLRLSVAAIVAATAFVLPGLLADRGHFQYNHGPLCEAHAAWEADCEACHEPFSPINENTWLHDWIYGRPQNNWQNVRCMKCHAGPEHHPVLSASEQTCGSCHRDHQGREASLVDLPEQDCTRCHADLASHMPGDRSPAYFDVKGFSSPEDHPQFRLLDPKLSDWKPEGRTLKFSHALHMMPGQAYASGQVRATTLQDIPAELRDHYRADDSGFVQLDCASCHQLDAAAAGAVHEPTATFKAGMPRSDGRYYLPTDFDTHCRACHAIKGFDGQEPDWELPHGKTVAELDGLLGDHYSRRVISEEKWGWPDEARPASDRLDPPWPSDAEKEAARSRVADKVREAKSLLLKGDLSCGKCHDYQTGSEADEFPTATVAARVPSIYFRHAKFDHAAHRAMDCRSCHPGAYSAVPRGGKADLVEKEPLDLPGVENCMTCHGPQRTVSEGKLSRRVGGVAYRCTECHTYHNGSHPLEGRGSPAWDPNAKMTIEQFLGGGH